MAQPPYVFKYQPPTDEAFSNLAKNSLWFCDPLKFNDPFDCRISFIKNKLQGFEVKTDFASFKKQLLDVVAKRDGDSALAGLNDQLERLGRRFEELAGDDNPAEFFSRSMSACMQSQMEDSLGKFRGVACFSEISSHLLMWGHYAKGHSGFCLKFDTTVAPLNGEIKKVQYLKSLPELHEIAKPDGMLGDLLPYLTVKAEEWSYEREWRLLRQRPDELVPLPTGAIVAVYFGSQMLLDHKKRIAHLVDGKGIELFEMKMMDSAFSLESSPWSGK